MPTYEYACPDCGGNFEIRVSMREKKRLKPACTKCGGKNAVQVFGSVTILTGGKGGSSHCCPASDPTCCSGPSR